MVAVLLTYVWKEERLILSAKKTLTFVLKPSPKRFNGFVTSP